MYKSHLSILSFALGATLFSVPTWATTNDAAEVEDSSKAVENLSVTIDESFETKICGQDGTCHFTATSAYCVQGAVPNALMHCLLPAESFHVAGKATNHYNREQWKYEAGGGLKANSIKSVKPHRWCKDPQTRGGLVPCP